MTGKRLEAQSDHWPTGLPIGQPAYDQSAAGPCGLLRDDAPVTGGRASDRMQTLALFQTLEHLHLDVIRLAECDPARLGTPAFTT